MLSTSLSPHLVLPRLALDSSFSCLSLPSAHMCATAAGLCALVSTQDAQKQVNHPHREYPHCTSQKVTPTAPHGHCPMNTDPHYTSHTLIPLHLTDTAPQTLPHSTAPHGHCPPPFHGHYPPHTSFFKKLPIRSFPSHTLFYGRP